MTIPTRESVWFSQVFNEIKGLRVDVSDGLLRSIRSRASNIIPASNFKGRLDCSTLLTLGIYPRKAKSLDSSEASIATIRKGQALFRCIQFPWIVLLEMHWT